MEINKLKGKWFVADTETTGLVEDLKKQGENAKLHNLAVIDVNDMLNNDSVMSEKITLFHAETKEQKKIIQDFFDQGVTLIMHNAIGYDSVALEVLGYDVSKVTFIDTYALSLYLYLERPRHGLEYWGIDLGVEKPIVKDWKNLTQKDYDNRVIEDVKINYLLYKKIRKDLEELYSIEDSDDLFFNHKIIRYLNSKMDQLKQQEKNKFLIDVDLCVKTIEEYELLIQEKNEALKKSMPKVPIVKKANRPKKPFKKDGTLSATGEKWKEITDVAGVSFDFEQHINIIDGYSDPNPNSHSQVKDWLFSLGWKPCTYKFSKDEEGNDKKIPQIYIKDSGGEVTPSIEKLVEENEALKDLTGKSVISHRLGVLKGFLSSIDDENMVCASASGFTNTLRLKHKKPLVNLPSVNKPYSSAIRACLKAKEGKVLYGSDLSGLETILKLNYQLPYDPKFVKEQQSDDFDPHLAIAIEANIVTQAQSDFYKIAKEGFPEEKYESSEELKSLLLLVGDAKKTKIVEISGFRHIGKQANYSCQYNAGAKAVSRSADIPLQVAQKVVSAYRQKNWSISAIAKDQDLQKKSTGTWLKNPLNGFFYYIKAEKDVFSTLVQGSGSFILDLWISFCFKLRKERGIDFDLLATFHDELIFEIDDTETMKLKIKELADDALVMVNNLLKLTIPIKSSFDYGYKYSDIH